MLFSIQPDGPVPIYEQIVAQVIYGVAAGTLEVGTFIPSVRELAEHLLVHPNTVARAFQELERAGVVTARRGRGMEVAEEAPAACQARRQELVRQPHPAGAARGGRQRAAARRDSHPRRGRAGRRQREAQASGETLMETVIETRDLTKQLRRQGRGRSPEPHGAQGRHLRPAGRQRRRQDDHHSHADGPAAGRQRLGQDPRAGLLVGGAVAAPPGRLCSRTAALLRLDDRSRRSAGSPRGFTRKSSGRATRSGSASSTLDPKARLKNLSKGQYAKVGLALALAVDPEVLILDEPTSGLDLLVRREFLEQHGTAWRRRAGRS